MLLLASRAAVVALAVLLLATAAVIVWGAWAWAN